MKENSFKLAKERSRRYPAETITDDADDIALIANTPAQAESLLHNLERAASCIGLHVNADKKKYKWFNERGDNFTLNGCPLKLVDTFTYLGSSVTSTENDINTRLAEAGTAIDRLSIIWKSDMTDKIKRSFFQAAVMSILQYGFTKWMLSVWRKSLTAITQECCEQYWTSPGGNMPQNSSYKATCHPLRKLSKLDQPDMRETAGEVRTNA